MSFVEFHNDISLSTVVLTFAGGVAVWVLKKTLTFLVTLLVDAIGKLVKKLTETVGKVELLEVKLDSLTKAVGDHEKLRGDIKVYFDELKSLKKKFEEIEAKNH
jgi:hypothetical protein